MAFPQRLPAATVWSSQPTRRGCAFMTLEEVVNEHFLARYRALLDAEDVAFDELEHAYEDGDRITFLADLESWQDSVSRRLSFLRRAGLESEPAAVVT